MNNDKDLLALKALAEKATPGPWTLDTTKSEGEYGTDEDGGRGFTAYVVADSEGRPLMDSLNRDQSEIHEEHTDEEHYAWDELAKRDAQFIAAANPAAILSLISRIEQQEELVARLRRQVDAAAEREADRPPTPAVDLSGLTRYNAHPDNAGAMMVRPQGNFVKFTDVQSLLSSPVVGEGKMTDEVQFLRNVVNDAAPMLRTGGFPKTADILEVATKSVEREVLATGKTTHMVDGAPLFPERDPLKPAEQQGLFRKFEVRRVDGSDKPGGKHEGCRYFVLDLNHDQHAPAAMRAYASSCAGTHPQLAADLKAEFGEATPSTPSQAWEGELPELPHHDRVFWQNGTNGVLELYRGDQMQDYARKAIGAAVAGVRDGALEEAARVCEGEVVEKSGLLEQEAHNYAARQCASLVRALKTHPVSQQDGEKGGEA